MLYEYQQPGYLISTDKSKLQTAAIHQWLSTESYWAKNIPLSLVEKYIRFSYCFGVYAVSENKAPEQIGFARLITDHATFAYLADVYILPSHQKKGLSKWLMECIISNPELQGLRRWMLATRDAHGLYRQYGFEPLDHPDRIMQITNPGIYDSPAS